MHFFSVNSDDFNVVLNDTFDIFMPHFRPHGSQITLKNVTVALFKPKSLLDKKGDSYFCGRPWWFLLFSGPSGKSRGFSGDRNLCGLSDKPGNKGILKPRFI